MNMIITVSGVSFWNEKHSRRFALGPARVERALARGPHLPNRFRTDSGSLAISAWVTKHRAPLCAGPPASLRNRMMQPDNGPGPGGGRRRLLLLAPPEGLLLSDHSPGYVLLPWMCTVRDIAPSIDEILIHYVLDDSP